MNVTFRSAAAGDAFIGNPFSTRHTRPGAVAPLDAVGRPVDVAGLCKRLASQGGSGAIVGAHGSGKTTLLDALARGIEARGGPVARRRIRTAADGLRAMRAVWRAPAGGTVCIDSWERMGAISSRLTALLARAVGCHLLVTSHRPTSVPTLIVCETSPSLLAAIVGRLPGLDQQDDDIISGADIETAFRHHAGNIRESLYELYDRFEERIRRPPIRL